MVNNPLHQIPGLKSVESAISLSWLCEVDGGTAWGGTQPAGHSGGRVQCWLIHKSWDLPPSHTLTEACAFAQTSCEHGQNQPLQMSSLTWDNMSVDLEPPSCHNAQLLLSLHCCHPSLEKLTRTMWMFVSDSALESGEDSWLLLVDDKFKSMVEVKVKWLVSNLNSILRNTQNYVLLI
jgi:hypothetical protein